MVLEHMLMASRGTENSEKSTCTGLTFYWTENLPAFKVEPSQGIPRGTLTT